MSLLNTGVTAIATAQLGLATTQHNIANVNTPGYSRQAAMQATNIGIMTGAGSVGQGVHVNTILRSYSGVLTDQLTAAQTQSSQLDTYYSMIARIDNTLADPTSGLSPVMQEFFKGVQDVAANPTLVSARQSMVSAAQAMTTRFQTLEGRLTQLYDETNVQIQDTVKLINTYSTEVAALNEKIVALSTGMGQPPNDLLDQRDNLVMEMNKLVRISTVEDSQGYLNLFAGSGQQLVVGNQASMLEARPSVDDAERFVVALKGSPNEFPEDYLSGGKLGGLLSFRSEALDAAANSLGQVALSMAQTFNAQHAWGQDLLGNNQFNDPTGAQFVADFFDGYSLKQPTPKSTNLGTADLVLNFAPLSQKSTGDTSNFYSDFTASDYKVSFDAAGDYSLVRLSDGKTLGSGAVPATVTFDGLELQINTSGANGDSFLLQPTKEIARNIAVNTDIATDVRKIAAAAPMRTTAGFNNQGKAVISQGVVVGQYPVVPDYDLTGLTPPGMTLSIADNAGTLELSGFPGGPVNYTSGMTISFNGLSFKLSGEAKVGDTFTIATNVNGVADARNMVKLGALQTANTTSGGVATYQVSYSQMVSEIGTKTRQAMVSGEAQATLLQQTQESRDALAGVNLDEEAANLIKYQQSYQAAARMMDTASKLFDTLLSIGR